jgi:hypothetical protein
MNDFGGPVNHEPLRLDRVVFDRLVDGALSAAEYRRVLKALEQQPSAWRLCAEAFLESQAWRGELGSLRPGSRPALVERKPQPANPPQQTRSANWVSMSLVALASFFLAFAVAQVTWQRPNLPPFKGQGSPHNIAESPRNIGPGSADAPTTLVSHNQPLGKVQLAVNRGAGEEPTMVDVPVYDEASASQLLINSRPALPEDLVQALEAEGHQVDLQRQFLPVPLDDGRQMMLPVEGYRIVPVSRPSY